MTWTILSVPAPASLAEAQVTDTEESMLEVGNIFGDTFSDLSYNLNEAFDTKTVVIQGEGFVDGAKVEFIQVFPNGTIYTIAPSSEKIKVDNPKRLVVSAPLTLAER